jgi:hypothetical protein
MNISKIITDPTTRTMTLLLALAIMIILLMRQCSAGKDLRDQLEESKKETERAEWNLQASNDTIKTYRDKNGILNAEIKSMWISAKQREEYTSDLEEKYGKLKGKLASSVSIGGSISGTAKNIKTESIADSIIKFSDSKDWGDGNYRNISGVIPYKIQFNRHGDTISTSLVPGKASIGYNYGVSLVTGIEMIDGKPNIFVKSKHPELSISSLQGAQVEPEKLDSKKNRWGVGTSLGVGLIYGYGTPAPTLGFHLGFGLVYLPKKYQF